MVEAGSYYARWISTVAMLDAANAVPQSRKDIGNYFVEFVGENFREL